MTISNIDLEKLHQKGSELASSAESLAALFEAELTNLKRKDEVTRLNVLRSTVLQQVERATGEEMAAAYGHSKAEVVTSLFQLGGGLIAMTSENRTMRAISRELLADSGGREPTYGTVLVRIGPKGLPEDVEVVCISRLARKSKQDESEVMDRLLARGNLLFGEKPFSHLIDRLAGEILKGGLSLPVSTERLSQLQEGRILRLNPPKNKD